VNDTHRRTAIGFRSVVHRSLAFEDGRVLEVRAVDTKVVAAPISSKKLLAGESAKVREQPSGTAAVVHFFMERLLRAPN
jgi:hypothetical protein